MDNYATKKAKALQKVLDDVEFLKGKLKKSEDLWESITLIAQISVLFAHYDVIRAQIVKKDGEILTPITEIRSLKNDRTKTRNI